MSEHPREIDPVTGYDTTGHDWNGIRELNTPFPKIVIWALVLSFAYSVIAWVLLPAWPVGRDYTRGLLGLDQGEMATTNLARLTAGREEWLARFEAGDFEAIAADPALNEIALPAAERLFLDNCAACHGTRAEGGPGFPALTSGDWLWGGDPETVAETIAFGINSTHPDTRYAQMPSFRDVLQRDELRSLIDYVVALPEGAQEEHAEGAALFAEHCAACHGEEGEGGYGVGAPSLADDAVLYGQDRGTVWTTLQRGRAGVMPHWQGRLSQAQINLLAYYVTQLASENTDAEP